MKSLTFIAITLISGAISGTFLGIINQGIVEPYIEAAIAIEVHDAQTQGEMIDPVQFDNYRLWQKGGEIFAGTILGLSYAALFGVVFAYARSSLPGSNNKKKAVILSGIVLLVLFIVPSLKYPANPPAVGNPATLYTRQILYIGFIAISGFSAMGLAFVYKNKKMANRRNGKIMIASVYAAIMAVAFIAMPPNPDQIFAPMDLVIAFRIASAFTMSVFWGLTGLILGSFWDKLRLHETSNARTI